MEYAGACYHVIGRGNYRNWIFATEGARKSFRRCLVQAYEAQGWYLHAWCLMGNHYHERFLVSYRWLAARLNAGPVKSLVNRVYYYKQRKRARDSD
jgi:hypothetical protein